MSFGYRDDFKFYDENNKPYNWFIEKNTSLTHAHSTVQGDGYCVLLAGNKHLANTPPLKNFRLKLNLEVRPSKIENYGFTIFFRYNRILRAGYGVTCSFTAESLSVGLQIFNLNKLATIKKTVVPLSSKNTTHDVVADLSVKDNVFKIKLNKDIIVITDENNTVETSGLIGFDKSKYHGELLVKNMALTAQGVCKRKPVQDPLIVDLPCTNGMSVPYRYALSLFKYDGGPYELEMEVSGGIKSRPDRIKGGGQWCHEIDMLRNPYVRIESSQGECGNLILFNGLLTLFDREEKRPFPVIHKPVEWPLKRKVYFDDLPDLSSMTFALGYDYFENDPIRYASGPLEVIIDNKGNLLHQGHSLRKGDVALTVASSENKAICSLIPTTLADRDKALKHARNNHYFINDEKIVFDIKTQYYRELFSKAEFSLDIQVQNVFGEVLAKKINSSKIDTMSSTDEALGKKLGINCLSFKVEIIDKLGVGVYHLSITLKHGDKKLLEEVKAFEVISDSPDALSPPIASGLPLLFSTPNEIKYLETDAFDPWSDRAGSEAEHYYSMSCFYPEISRHKRPWELLSLYKRQWFLWLTDRTSGGSLAIDDNRDIIQHSDYVDVPYENPKITRYDLWKYTSDTEEVIDILIEFMKERAGKLDNIKTITINLLEQLRTDNRCLSEEAFIELFENCWKDWLQYFAVQFSAIRERQYTQLKTLDPKIKRASYGPFALYASHYKSVYFMKYHGYGNPNETEKHRDGFFLFEDYPYESGYTISRGIFSLMTIKLYHPQVKLFPDLYDTLIEGCNDGAFAVAHPPYGIYDLPRNYTAKRIFELCFAGAWFKDNQFHFWDDKGFHFRTPTRECVKELIDAWGKVLKLKPVKPIKTTCFLVDTELINLHADYYDKECNIVYSWKDIFNTAEECLGFSYEVARETGLPAGFVTTCENLSQLDAENVDLLVLPPLNSNVPGRHIQAIRDLHKKGVNLLGFENVHGIEDLFGVKLDEKESRIRKIGFTKECMTDGTTNSVELVEEQELCKSFHGIVGATPVLLGAENIDGELSVPVLSMNKTAWGETAFFNIPPTVVNREAAPNASYGRECISSTIREATAMILKKLSKPCVRVENGKLIAFQDEKNEIIAVVEEDSCTNGSNLTSNVLVHIRGSDLRTGDISCDKALFVAG